MTTIGAAVKSMADRCCIRAARPARGRQAIRFAAACALAMLGTPAGAQSSLRADIARCNGADRASTDARIAGCTAIIDSGTATKPVLAVAHNNRGNAYTVKGDYDNALLDYDRAVEANPSNALALNNRGAVYLKKGDYERAIANFDAALKLDATYGSALANRAETYLRQGDYERAAHDYDSALRLQPAAREAWNGRCWLRALTGELDGALKDCDESLRLGPNAGAFNSRALIRLKMRQWALAIADYSSALELDPRQASSYFGRGHAKQKSGDRAGGSADIKTAQTLKSDVAREFAAYGVR